MSTVYDSPDAAGRQASHPGLRMGVVRMMPKSADVTVNSIDSLLRLVRRLPTTLVALLDQARASAEPGKLAAVVIRESDRPWMSLMIVGTIEIESWLRGGPQGGRPGEDGTERAADENQRLPDGVSGLTEGVYALPDGRLMRVLERLAPGWEIQAVHGDGHWHIAPDGRICECAGCMGCDEDRLADFALADLELVCTAGGNGEPGAAYRPGAEGLAGETGPTHVFDQLMSSSAYRPNLLVTTNLMVAQRKRRLLRNRADARLSANKPSRGTAREADTPAPDTIRIGGTYLMAMEYYPEPVPTVKPCGGRNYGQPMPGEYRAALIVAGHLDDAEQVACIQYCEGVQRAVAGRPVGSWEPAARQLGCRAGLRLLQPRGGR